ncbi:hypothetical protein PG985_015028 [Apiospora marii]|uniref:uncharacterized protein n=1 Tax=Apiospora marii TaxID=335849 RepID=UPI00312CD84B
MADANCTVHQPHGNPDEQPSGVTGYTTPLTVASTEQSPKFVPFPNELILMIFELLPQHALRQLRLVNRATNALLPSPPRMILRNPCQNALYEAVTEALNAPPDSIENVRYVATKPDTKTFQSSLVTSFR